MVRRSITVWLVALVAVVAAPVVASAQLYPTRPVRLVVGSPPGSAPDLVARLYADKLFEYFGRRFVIENTDSDETAAAVAAAAAPDGYTMHLATGVRGTGVPGLVAPTPRLAGLDPIALLATAPTVMIAARRLAGEPIARIADLAVAAKARTIHYPVRGLGFPAHLAADLFAAATGVPLEVVPERDARDALTDLAIGRAGVLFAPLPALVEYVTDERYVPLAVLGTSRSHLAPSIPSIGEGGRPAIELTSWYGLAMPRGVPLEIKRELAHAVTRAMRDRTFRAAVAESGAEPVGATLDAFEAFLEAEPAPLPRVAAEAVPRG